MHSTNNHKILLYIVIGLIIVTASLPLYAAEVEGVYYSDSYMVDNKKLRLTGVGLLRYWGFKAYTGAFYLEEGTPVKDFFTDRTKRIELEYFRSLKEYHPRGFIRDKESNAVWGMQFIWPFKSEYRIVFLSDDYSKTVIGRSKRDYVWIMARKPAISDEEYAAIVDFLQEQGYDTSKLQKVPQRIN